MLSSPPRHTRSKQCELALMRGSAAASVCQPTFSQMRFSSANCTNSKVSFLCSLMQGTLLVLVSKQPNYSQELLKYCPQYFYPNLFRIYLSLKVQPLACMLFDYSVILFDYKNENWHLTVNIIRYLFP